MYLHRGKQVKRVCKVNILYVVKSYDQSMYNEARLYNLHRIPIRLMITKRNVYKCRISNTSCNVLYICVVKQNKSPFITGMNSKHQWDTIQHGICLNHKWYIIHDHVHSEQNRCRANCCVMLSNKSVCNHFHCRRQRYLQLH